MDLEQAMQLVLAEAQRTGNNVVARRLDVANSTVSKWKGGKRPEGDVKVRVLAFAEELRAKALSAPPVLPGAIPATVIIEARRQLAETHRDLSRIYGYAESIADMADQVSSKQRGLLAMLKPWVDTETDVRAGKIEAVLSGLEQLDAQDRLDAETTPDATGDAPPVAPLKRRKSAG